MLHSFDAFTKHVTVACNDEYECLCNVFLKQVIIHYLDLEQVHWNISSFQTMTTEDLPLSAGRHYQDIIAKFSASLQKQICNTDYFTLVMLQNLDGLQLHKNLKVKNF